MKILNKRSVSVAVMLIAGQLYAQPADSKKPADPTPAPAAAHPDVKLTPAEMTKHATDLEAAMRADLQHVQYLQTIERKKQDIIKLSCVNDKFVKLKAEANLFDQARGELTASLNSDERFAAYPHVGEAADRAHKVRNEADECAGQLELVRTSDANSSVTHPVIVDDPTSTVPFEGNTLVEEPAYASPFQ